MHQVAAKDKNYGREKETYNKRHGNGVEFLIFYITGKNYPPVGHKRADRKMAQFLGRSQGQAGIEAGDLEKKDENGQIGPVGYKRFEIYRAQVVQIDKEESETERKHGAQKIRHDKGGRGKGRTCTVVSAMVPVGIFGKGHNL
jgi:hypothetical protein